MTNQLDIHAFASRLKSIINETGETVNSFSQTIGIDRPTRMYDALKGKKPGVDLLLKIAGSYPSVNFDWLITGRGPMFLNTGEEEGEEIKVPEINPVAEARAIYGKAGPGGMSTEQLLGMTMKFLETQQQTLEYQKELIETLQEVKGVKKKA